MTRMMNGCQADVASRMNLSNQEDYLSFNGRTRLRIPVTGAALRQNFLELAHVCGRVRPRHHLPARQFVGRVRPRHHLPGRQKFTTLFQILSQNDEKAFQATVFSTCWNTSSQKRIILNAHMEHAIAAPDKVWFTRILWDCKQAVRAQAYS